MDHGTNHFIRAMIRADVDAGKHGGAVRTRFPPEPNGYLHVGHAKSICVNFGLAAEFGGSCNLRFDDTNPVAEETEYVDGILEDVRWLGFEPDQIHYASDYFEQLYLWAEQLVVEGKAYVDESSLEEMRAARGTVIEPGTPAPGRDRRPDENLDLFRRMRAGEFPDGAMVLRAKIDLAHPNMKMRDPLLYRIRHAHHHRTGDDWCIYPMYDWAHGQSDAIEHITHSLCTLEFANNRELYDWFTDALGFQLPPRQTEFARLNLTYTVISKRFLRRLVEEERVSGWDDPRMPTIAGMRRRGIPPSAIRAFAERVGVAKSQSTVDLALLDWSVRDDLNPKAPRRMVVLDPLEVELVGWSRTDVFTLDDFPHDVRDSGGTAPDGVDWSATREVALSGPLWIERSDFAVDPPSGFRRLVPGGIVRLRRAHVIRCDEVVTGDDGEVIKLRCTVVEDEGVKARGVIHWVSAATAVPVTVHVYDRLFASPTPGEATGDYMDDLNPDSLQVRHAWAEPAVSDVPVGGHAQFERHGYVFRASEDVHAGLVFTVVVGLKDTWASKDDVVGEAEEVTVDPNATPEAQARIKALARAAYFASHPEGGDLFVSLVQAGAGEDTAWTVASDATLRRLHADAVAFASPAPVATWLANVVVAEAKALGVGDRAVSGEQLGKLVALVEAGTLNATLGKQVLGELLQHGGDPETVARAKGWAQVSDESALDGVVDGVLAAHPEEVARYRAGDKRLFGFFMGQVMKATKGKGNPGVLKGLLGTKLG